MDKSKIYKITQTHMVVGSSFMLKPNKSAEHRIGRVGNILKAEVGAGLKFAYQDGGMLHTSKIQEIRKDREIVQIHTLNTVYVLKEVVEGEKETWKIKMKCK